MELDLAQRLVKTAVVFPPNLLQHPEAAQFVTESIQRGLKAIVRLRPSQLLDFSELIATLTYRGADVEVIVSQPLTEKILQPRREIKLPNFKTVFVPTRAHDPILLFDSLPFSWRLSVEVLSCLPENQSGALSPDELFLMMNSLGQRVRPYVEIDRNLNGIVPGADLNDHLRFSFSAKAGNESEIDLSVIIAIDDTAGFFDGTLEALKSQSVSTSKFEICFGLDNVNDEKVEELADWSRQSGLNVRAFELPKGYAKPAGRKSQCWNLAISHARGSRLVVLQSDLLLQSDLTLRKNFIATSSSVLVSQRIQKYIDVRSTSPSVALTLRHYFDLAGFSEAVQEPGIEFDFLIWKSEQLGYVARERNWATSERDIATPSLSRRQRNAKTLAVQRFYLCTLNADVFKTNYEWLGTQRILRRVYNVFAQSSMTATLKAFTRTLNTKLKSATLDRKLRSARSQGGVA